MSQQLRHGANYVGVSDIADQFYCEHKVHLKWAHPTVRIELPVLRDGTAVHAAIASQAVQLTPREIDNAIRVGKELALSEHQLEGSFQGVEIRGRTDFLAIKGMEAQLLLDFKFTGASEPFRDQRVQAEIYAWLVESMGFEVSGLCVGIVMFPNRNSMRRPGDKKALIERIKKDGRLQAIHERCEQARNALRQSDLPKQSISSTTWRASVWRYDRQSAEKNLRWAFGYWLQQRDPLPVGRMPFDRWRGKCGACPWNALNLCEHALTRSNEDLLEYARAMPPSSSAPSPSLPPAPPSTPF